MVGSTILVEGPTILMDYLKIQEVTTILVDGPTILVEGPTILVDYLKIQVVTGVPSG